MKPEVICTEVVRVTVGQDLNIITACSLMIILCVALLAWMHPGVSHWFAVRLKAREVFLVAKKKGGRRAGILEMKAFLREFAG